jgi:hypothetical protein
VWLVRRWCLHSLFAEAFAHVAVAFGEEMQKREDARVPDVIAVERAVSNKTAEMIVVKQRA